MFYISSRFVVVLLTLLILFVCSLVPQDMADAIPNLHDIVLDFAKDQSWFCSSMRGCVNIEVGIFDKDVCVNLC